MKREELAARIFSSSCTSHWWNKDKDWVETLSCTPEEAFTSADEFIAYAEKQKLQAGLKQAKEFAAQHNPVEECEHANITPATNIKTGYGDTTTWALCRECQRTFPPGEEPAQKPEVIPREFLIGPWGDGTYHITPWFGQGTIPSSYAVFREVLK